jgi:hypothetical protein
LLFISQEDHERERIELQQAMRIEIQPTTIKGRLWNKGGALVWLRHHQPNQGIDVVVTENSDAPYKPDFVVDGHAAAVARLLKKNIAAGLDTNLLSHTHVVQFDPDHGRARVAFLRPLGGGPSGVKRLKVPKR